MSRWVRTLRRPETDGPKRIVRAIYEMAGGEPMIDLGCGECLLTSGLKGVFVDMDRRAGTPSDAIIADITKAPDLLGRRFNLGIMTDVIEHLTRADGESLLKKLSYCCSAILVFTPTGPLWLSESPGPHAHRSGWTPEEFYVNGWNIWEWPIFHSFDEGHIHGAFWAWNFPHRPANPTLEDVAKLAEIKL